MTRYCKRPDRDVPSIECGYPMPCPYHTVIVEQKTGKITYPTEDIDEKTKEKIKDIANVLKEAD